MGNPGYSVGHVNFEIPFSHLRASQVVLVVKNLPANAGDTRDAGLIPWLARSPGVGKGKLFQYSCMENSIDGGIWQAPVHLSSSTWVYKRSEEGAIAGDIKCLIRVQRAEPFAI